MDKIQQFFAEAKKAGWTPELTRNGPLTTVTATTGDRTISVTWLANACKGASRTINGKTAKLRNASAARRALWNYGPIPRQETESPMPDETKEPSAPAVCAAKAVRRVGGLSVEAQQYSKFLNRPKP